MNEDLKKMLDSMSEKERKVALLAMEEMASKGKSKTYEDIIYSDYKEIPVDIETFITDDNYLGKAWKDANGKLKLYPFWLKTLKKIFPNNIETAYDTLLESGARGLGKAQPLDCPVFTEHGYRPMGSIKLGDKVYGADGKLHNVIGVFPQGLKPIYEIEFTDNSKTLCAEEHLWTVRDNKDMKMKTLTTKEIIDAGVLRNGHLASGKYREARFKLPLTQALQFEHKDMLISPYLIGCLLGDGCFSECIGLTTYDEYIKNYLEEEVSKYDYKLSIDRKTYIPIQINKTNHNIYKDEIVRLGLWKHTSYDKFIPEEYLYNDAESRLALLQGLMDTDGYADRRGSNTYLSTCSEQLAKDTLFLAQSLGATGYIKHKTNCTYKYKGEVRPCKDQYIVTIKLPSNLNPFRLERKASRMNPNRIEPQRNIRSITYVGEQECQCIVIDSDEHLYLTNDLIVTHNSEVACGCVCAYLMYRVMCLKNPLQYYHIKLTEKIAFAFMNIKLELSEAIAVDKFQKTIQMSPWFMARGSMTQRNNKKYWVPPEPLEIIIGSQSDDVIGRPIFFAFFDEISFLKNKDVEVQKKKALDMIDTAIGGMKTRFIHNGKNPTLLVVASSKKSEQSFMESYIRQLKETQSSNTYVVDEPVWAVKPEGTYNKETFFIGLGNKFLDSIVIPDADKDNLQAYKERGYQIIEAPIDFRAKALEDLDRALCDYAGISSFSSNKFLSAERVNECVVEEIQNPLPDIITVGDGRDDTAQYYDFFDMNKVPKEYICKPLFIHLDLSKSGDKTGICGTWIIGKKPTAEGNPGKDLFFQPAFSTSIQAPKGRSISFEKNRNFIRWLKDKGFKIKEITADTFQSVDLLQILTAEGFNTNTLSVDRVETAPGETMGICKPYQYLKNTLYEKRIRLYKTDLLYTELVQLEKNNNTGKIDHPDGGRTGSKDQADALCGSVFTASKHAEEYAFDYGENLEMILQANETDGQIDQKQLVVDMEAELKNMFGGSIMQSQRQEMKKQQEQNIDAVFWNDDIIM